MGIYRVTIQGRSKPILVKADSLHEARAAVVTAEHMTAEHMTDALENGEKIWKAGDPLPADESLLGVAFGAGEDLKAGELVEIREDGKVYAADRATLSVSDEALRD